MSRVFVSSRGRDDWRRLLADPDKHWADGYSAKSLALVPPTRGCYYREDAGPDAFGHVLPGGRNWPSSGNFGVFSALLAVR